MYTPAMPSTTVYLPDAHAAAVQTAVDDADNDVANESQAIQVAVAAHYDVSGGADA